jgi:hypothetical protein
MVRTLLQTATLQLTASAREVNCRHSHRESNRKPRTHELLAVVNSELNVMPVMHGGRAGDWDKREGALQMGTIFCREIRISQKRSPELRGIVKYRFSSTAALCTRI